MADKTPLTLDPQDRVRVWLVGIKMYDRTGLKKVNTWLKKADHPITCERRGVTAKEDWAWPHLVLCSTKKQMDRVQRLIHQVQGTAEVILCQTQPTPKGLFRQVATWRKAHLRNA